jgi:hypothetical protein
MTSRSLRIAASALATGVACFAIISLQLSIPISTAQVGLPYSSSISATGGIAPYTYAIIAGSLPPTLTLNSSTGAITGIPNTAGTFNFTAQVTDSSGTLAATVPQRRQPAAPAGGVSVSAPFSIVVSPFTPPSSLPVPPSVLLAAIGLVAAGLYQMWRKRQTA